MGAQRNSSPADGYSIAHTNTNGCGRGTVQASIDSNGRVFKKGDKVVAHPKFATDPEESSALPATTFDCAVLQLGLKQLEKRAVQESRRLLAFENLEKKYSSTTMIVRFVFLRSCVLRAVHTAIDLATSSSHCFFSSESRLNAVTDVTVRQHCRG